MRVTITTDASYCHASKIGTYAFWISFNGGPVLRVGRLKSELNGSIAAEAAAIGNAISCLARSGVKARKVYINTDCLSMKEFLMGESRADKQFKTIQKVVSYVHEMCRVNKWELTVRHIKAHSGDKSSKAYVNNWCDNSARNLLREIRDEKT